MSEPTAYNLHAQAELRLRARVLNLTDLELAAVMADTIDGAKLAEDTGCDRIAAFWTSCMLLINEERCRRDRIYAAAFGDDE